jgi:hypothetical protein
MSLEEYIPDIDSSEWWWSSAEASKEVSEKFKEGMKKSWKKRKKVQKDEKKARKWDFLLASFLIKIIINKKYDKILNYLCKIIDDGFPSNFLLWILSLINIDITNKIREYSNKEKIIFNYKEETIKEFDDNHLNGSIKNRINMWVEDMIDIVSIEYSSILTNKLIKLINKNEDTIVFTSKVFTFFLNEINISITESKSIGIAEFILGEVEKSLQKLEIEEI